MFTGKRAKLSRSQYLCLGRIEIPEVRLFPRVLAPQIGPISDFEGEPVTSTSRPSIGFLRTSTSGHAVVELTSSRIDSPPWRVSNRNSSHNNDGTDVIDSRAESISVNDLKHVGSRTFFLESTEVMMYILTISEGTLQSKSNRFCYYKARSRINNDRYLSQVLVLARTFRRRTSTNSPRSCSIKRILDFSSEYMMSLVSSCCTDSACSELWIERISGNSKDVRGGVLQVVCVCGVLAIDLDPHMSLRGLHAVKRWVYSGWTRRNSRYTGSSSRALLNSQDHVSSSHSQRYRNVRRFLDPTRRLARILTSRGDSPVLTGGIGNSHTGCPSR